MLDLAAWSQRAAAFTDNLRGRFAKAEINSDLGPSYTLAQIRDLSSRCPLPIPSPLIDWNLTVGRCHCSYHLLEIDARQQHLKNLVFPDWPSGSLWGGADLIDLSDAITIPADFREIALSFEESGFTQDARLRANSFPLFREANSDFIGLYLGDGAADPPVVYLCRELCGASKIISPSFEQFLIVWEQLRYIGCHYLLQFVNPATGLGDRRPRRER